MTDLERLRRCHALVAELAIDQPLALAIFGRLDEELMKATQDPVQRARMALQQSGPRAA